MNDDPALVLHRVAYCIRLYAEKYLKKNHTYTHVTRMYNEFNRIIKNTKRKCLTPCVSVSRTQGFSV